MINTVKKPAGMPEKKPDIKRIYIKADEDDGFHVYSESSRGVKTLMSKFKRKDEAIDYVRKIARANNIRFSGEDA